MLQGIEFIGLVMLCVGVVFLQPAIAITGGVVMIFTFAVEKLSQR